MDNWATAFLPPALAALHGDSDGVVLLASVSAAWYTSSVPHAAGAGMKERLSLHTISYLGLVAIVAIFLFRAWPRTSPSAGLPVNFLSDAIPSAAAYGLVTLAAPPLLHSGLSWPALRMDGREVTLILHGACYCIAIWLRHAGSVLLRTAHDCTFSPSPLACALHTVYLPPYTGVNAQLWEVIRTLLAGMSILALLACSHVASLPPPPRTGAAPPPSLESARGKGAVETGVKVATASNDAAIAWYTQAAVIIVGVEYPWLWLRTGCEPFTWVALFVTSSSTRVALFLFWALSLTLLITCASIYLHDDGTRSAQRLLLVRKVFHVAAVLMFAPATVLGGLDMLALSLTVALKVMTLLEGMRALHGPPEAVSRSIQVFMGTFTDDRDAGVFVLTHLYLIAGCTVPVWMALSRGGPQHDALEILYANAGILSLGLGDTCAAVAGITAARLGMHLQWGRVAAWWAPREEQQLKLRKRLPPALAPSWSRKTVQGSVAFVMAVIAGMAALESMRTAAGAAARTSVEVVDWSAVVFVACIAAWVETSSALIDNVVVPLWTAAAVATILATRAAWGWR